jgi:hypothetical protein
MERRRARAVPCAYGEVSPGGEDHFKVVAIKIGEMAVLSS